MSSNSSPTTPSSRAPSCRATRSRRRCAAKLPAYMVPAYPRRAAVDPDDALATRPTTRSCRSRRCRASRPATTATSPPKTENERILHAALCEVLRVERVSTEHHFFDDLGANSLLMARFCASIRKNPRHVECVDARHLHQPDHRAARRPSRLRSIDGFVATKPEPFHVPSNLAYYTCGALQAAFYAAYALFGLWVLDTGYEWAIAASRRARALRRAASSSPRARSSRSPRSRSSRNGC